jgi:hypothetical protein
VRATKPSIFYSVLNAAYGAELRLRKLNERVRRETEENVSQG